MAIHKFSPAFVPDEPRSAFGEVLVAQPHPRVQIKFPYNINPDIVRSCENNSGTVTQADGMAVVQSGASANSGAILESRGPISYAPGQGVSVRCTALFTTGVSNSEQIVGVGNQEDGFFFGYDGATFGALHRFGGRSEIQTLTVTTGAVTSTGNITINLDSVATLVAVTSGDTAREVAVKISDADFSDAGAGWIAHVHNETVIFRSETSGLLSGTFTLVDTDTTGAVGTFSETVAGVSSNDDWIPQSTWNHDKFDGTGESGVTIDTTKGNVFEIKYQWLGFGEIEFSIENPTTGRFVLVHRIAYANANVIPSIQNPDIPLHVSSINGSNTSNLTIKTGSMAGFTEGVIRSTGPIFTAANEKTTISTTEVPILSLKNVLIYQGVQNRNRIRLLVLSVATEATKPITVHIHRNPTLTGPVAFAAGFSGRSTSETDTGATGLVGGEDIATLSLGKLDSQRLTVDFLEIELDPGDLVVMTAFAASGSGHDVAVSVTWRDLQ